MQKTGRYGTSAGGILITRAITERPDLYAAVNQWGCNNAMRMENTPNGPGNIPWNLAQVKDSTECRALYEMDGTAHVQYGGGISSCYEGEDGMTPES